MGNWRRDTGMTLSMTPCPRCDEGEVVTGRDVYGDTVKCLTCGWAGETRPASEEDNYVEVIDKRVRKPRLMYEISPSRYKLGAPKPRRNDFIDKARYQAVYQRWRYHNLEKGSEYEPSVNR